MEYPRFNFYSVFSWDHYSSHLGSGTEHCPLLSCQPVSGEKDQTGALKFFSFPADNPGYLPGIYSSVNISKAHLLPNIFRRKTVKLQSALSIIYDDRSVIFTVAKAGQIRSVFISSGYGPAFPEKRDLKDSHTGNPLHLQYCLAFSQCIRNRPRSAVRNKGKKLFQNFPTVLFRMISPEQNHPSPVCLEPPVLQGSTPYRTEKEASPGGAEQNCRLS